MRADLLNMESAGTKLPRFRELLWRRLTRTGGAVLVAAAAVDLPSPATSCRPLRPDACLPDPALTDGERLAAVGQFQLSSPSSISSIRNSDSQPGSSRSSSASVCSASSRRTYSSIASASARSTSPKKRTRRAKQIELDPARWPFQPSPALVGAGAAASVRRARPASTLTGSRALPGA